jgi:hypothetical protein
MIFIYSQHIGPRLQYITKFIFSGILQVPYKLTSDATEYTAFDGPKINYSFQSLDGINILPDPILKKNEITDIEVEVVWKNNLPLLFHQCADVPLPFDPFAASFYMVSRYEEYTNKECDIHGRFQASSSLAGKNGFISIPVVDRWAFLIRDVIIKTFPDYKFPERSYQYIPTIDVDSVAAFKGKSFLRLMGGTAKALFRGNFPDLVTRWNTWVLKQPDPLDTFQILDNWHHSYKLNPLYFILIGKHSKFDGNLPSNSPLMMKTIRDIASQHTIGIHPSYFSDASANNINNEIDTLQNLCGEKITRSRQHFLKLKLPDTYQNLIKCGILEDYTMGFADAPGFRAGTCTPFPFYDLSTEKETELMIYPLIVMDATLQSYRKLSSQDALALIGQLINEIKDVKGTFISLWHNSFLYDSKKTSGWKTIYPLLLEKSCE